MQIEGEKKFLKFFLHIIYRGDILGLCEISDFYDVTASLPVIEEF